MVSALSSGELDFISQIVSAVILIITAIVSGYLGRMFFRAQRTNLGIICYSVTLLVLLIFGGMILQFRT